MWWIGCSWRAAAVTLIVYTLLDEEDDYDEGYGG